MDRLAKTGLAAAGIALASGLALWPGPSGAAEPSRQSFDILTGSAGGNYFPVGELIARAISHPPGLARCERTGVCAPPGIIVSARTSDGAVANVLAVDAGSAASGLAQTPVVADAVSGRGPFRQAGRQTHIRVMADLFGETVQLVARPGIASVADLRGKRIAVGNEGSGGDVIATAILSASGVRAGVIRHQGADASVAALRQGRIDAFFFLGGAPAPAIAGLVAGGEAKLVAIGGKLRTRLLTRVPGLSAETIAAGLYRGTGPLDTVGARTLWIANDGAPSATVYGIVRALFNPANRELLAQGERPAPDIRLGETANLDVVPLHPGAVRFYRESGMLAAPQRR